MATPEKNEHERPGFDDLPDAVVELNRRLDRIEELIQQQGEGSPDQALTAEEASEFLGLAKTTLYSLVSRGELPSSKRGKRLYFSREALRNWLLEGERRPATPGMRDHIAKMQEARRKKAKGDQ